MKQKILECLSEIEAAENIKVVYACESGIRAWGFPSSDSDYDVRFIYVRPIEWYLSIFDRRDVIERPIDGLPDITGWDLRKALQLLRKSNPHLLEWLGSPMVYWEKYSIAKRAGAELDRGQRIATIGNFIERELKRLGGKEIHHDRRLLPGERLDELFRGSIKEVWRNSIPNSPSIQPLDLD